MNQMLQTPYRTHSRAEAWSMDEDQPLASAIRKRVAMAARKLGASDPNPYVGDLIDRSFALPAGSQRYGENLLTPGAAPFEPSFSEREPNVLRFTVEPLGPDEHPISRRDETTREMRRLVGGVFGRDALRWFDSASEEWRGHFSNPRLRFGAWFGSAYDQGGLHSAKAYYELGPGNIHLLSDGLTSLIRIALQTLPSLVPVFTTITCKRDEGRQRVTFFVPHTLRLSDLQPLLQQLGMEHQLPSILQIVGLTLGGRFDLPAYTLLIGLAGTPERAEIKLEILLGLIPDLPAAFPDLLRLGLAERPRQLAALEQWYDAFTPEEGDWPGNLSVLSVVISPNQPARINVYLRPVEFDLASPASS